MDFLICHEQRLNIPQNYSEKSDVYSFGVFLLELISGCEAHNKNMLHPDENIVFQVYPYMLNASIFLDFPT